MIENTESWFRAAAEGDLTTIRSMIVDGFDIDLRDDQERTAFHVAAQNMQTDVMTAILAARQMGYLRRMGVDPFSIPLTDMAEFANENRRTA